MKQLLLGKSVLMFLIQFGISLAIFIFLVLQIDLREFLSALLKVKLGYLLIGFILFPLGQVICAVKWRFLARPLGIQRDLKRMVGLYFVGMFLNFLLPTSIGGDITRSLYLGNEAGNTRTSFLSVLVERGTGLLSLVILATIALLTSVGSALPPAFRYGFPVVALGSFLFFAFLPAILARTRTRLREIVSRDLIVFWKKPWIGMVAILYSMLSHILFVVIHFCVARALSLQIPVSYHFVTLCVASLASMIPSFNGIGVRDAAYIYLLSFLGISPSLGLLFSMIWFVMMAVSGFIGCIVYLMRGFRRETIQMEPGPTFAQEVSHGKT